MDLRELSTVADFFVLCTAASPRQLDAIREHAEEALTQHGAAVWHTEGSASAGAPAKGSSDGLRWVLMDFGAIVVHLMDPRTRAFYRLEDLWRDAPRLPLDAHTSSL
jgi:ribosome-associated protein